MEKVPAFWNRGTVGSDPVPCLESMNLTALVARAHPCRGNKGRARALGEEERLLPTGALALRPPTALRWPQLWGEETPLPRVLR